MHCICMQLLSNTEFEYTCVILCLWVIEATGRGRIACIYLTFSPIHNLIEDIFLWDSENLRSCALVQYVAPSSSKRLEIILVITAMMGKNLLEHWIRERHYHNHVQPLSCTKYITSNRIFMFKNQVRQKIIITKARRSQAHAYTQTEFNLFPILLQLTSNQSTSKLCPT